MSTYAVVESGEVINVILWDGQADIGLPQNELVEIPEGQVVGIGYGYANGEFSQPSVSSVTLPEAQAMQTAIVQAAYGAAVQAPVAFKSAAGVTQTFDADQASQLVLMQTTQGYTLANAVPTGFYWKAADNTHIAFTLSDLQGLYAAMLEQGWNAFQKLQSLKAAIAAATSVSAVESILW
ncbi:DUF4376 domain-containing protein [Burkholderia cenocepacia]|uniref:DUF4376 domain-containing protein n=1 Tax=Burkholderia cenocepacia TaxID=95486 RepID=UPI00222E3D72|nr:DUF4376 domain-containing protein [Burkholderia cenocepacia]MCW3641763.1 DUF4376 domain-containing protein [Burkholderia cenocepacia]